MAGYIILSGFVAVIVGALLLLVYALKVSLSKTPADKSRRFSWINVRSLLCIQLIGVALIILGAALMPDMSVEKFMKMIAVLRYPQGDYDLTGSVNGHTPDPVRVGDAVTFNYTVKNIGRDKVPPVSYMVRFYVNGERASYDGATSALPAGSGVTYSMSKGHSHFIAERPGEYSYRLEIVPREGLVDANPYNNIITGTLMVR